MSNINYDKIIENESEREFYIESHDKILEIIKNNGKITFWQIVRLLQGSDRRILRLIEEMVKNNEIFLEDKYLFMNNAEKDKIFIKDVLCKKCEGKLIDLGSLEAIRNKMDQIYLEKPVPTFLFDQRPVTSDTTIKRAVYLMLNRDLNNKKILVLGDDDLTSIAIGFLGLAKEIIVLDIDERLINFINKKAKENNLNIKAHICDLTKGIPKEFENYFDVFLTDPTPNPECFSLFVSIGIKLLKNKAGMSGYVSFFPSHQKISLEFQKILTNKGLIITDMIPRFTEYDFVKFTYKDSDLELLRKYDSGERKLSFHENITRFVTSEESVNMNDPTEIKELPLSKATKRMLENPEMDPAFKGGDKEFVLNLIKKNESK
jgi:predicted methyltransferase